MFLILVLLTAWILVFALTPPGTIIKNNYTSYIMMGLLFLYVSIVLITFDNESVDMERYLKEYINFGDLSLSNAMLISSREYLFILFQWLTAQLSSNPAIFQFVIWMVISLLLFFSLRKIFTPWQLLIVLFCYLNYFVFFNYITNTIRQGFSISMIILAITIMLSDKKQPFLFYLSLITAPLFHATAIPLSIALFILKKFKVSLKFIVSLWVVFTLLYLTGLNQNIFGQFSTLIPAIDEYTSNSVLNRYEGGINRLDFLVFGGFWIVYAYFAKRKLFKEESPVYDLLLKIYIGFNIYFLVFGFIGYSDRIAAYSWFLVPVLILYPILKGNKSRPILLFMVILTFVIVSILGGSLLFNQPLFY